MRDKDLYMQILGIQALWKVTEVVLSVATGEVRGRVEHAPGVRSACSQCETPCPGYDHRSRTWRYLDTCQLKTLIVAKVPRVNCLTHGVVTVQVPWAESGTAFTALYEAFVLDWLKKAASIQAVARQLLLSWNAIAGIMQRAVRPERGENSRKPDSIEVDETSFRKRHDYVTMVTDQKEGHG
mgnify:CR=1 FL=1